MNSDPNVNHRCAIERLMHEFAASSDEGAPLLHQRLSGLPNQNLTQQAWSDFWEKEFSRTRKRKGEWEEWVAHSDGVCSRFFGSGDKAALDRFRRLADTGVALLSGAAANAGATWHFDTAIVEQLQSKATDDAYLQWMEMLHLTAKRCRTLLLHVTVGNWAYTLKANESPEEVASAMSDPTEFGLVALPNHPILESLQHDVVRSSVEAIKVWLGLPDVGRVGDWPDRPPIYLPPSTIPKRDAKPDDYEANILIKKFLDSNPGATIKAVAKEVSLSVGKVAKLDAWKRKMAERKANQSTPKKSPRQLTDKMLSARGRKDDPAAKLLEDEAILEWLLGKVNQKEKVELLRKTPDEKAAIIESARELYMQSNAESDD